MSKQPRLQETVLHKRLLKSSKFTFVSLAARESGAGVEWSGKILRDGRVVSYVSNSGFGQPNVYQVVDPGVFAVLKMAAFDRFPAGGALALDGFVAVLWADSLEVQYAGEAVASVGF